MTEIEGVPTPEDWLVVANSIRIAVNNLAESLGYPKTPLMTKACRVPTEEELAEYERLCPGAANRLRQMAREAMNHRLEMEQMQRGVTFLGVIVAIVWSAAIVFAYANF